MITLYFISWTVIAFGNYASMSDCYAVEEQINNETYYFKFRTLCFDGGVFDAAGNPKNNCCRSARPG